MISALMLFFYFMMLIISPCCNGILLQSGSPYKQLDSDNTTSTTSTLKSEQTHLIHRKLLMHGRCTNRDISISQSRGSSSPSGIPQYIVQIVNTCVSGCAPSNIHLHCGWFASARIVNPRIFKRMGFDDCLVKAGQPLKTSKIIRFAYYNSFMYPLGFKYAKFC